MTQTIWSGTSRAPVARTMKVPVDTGSTSAPGSLTLGDVQATPKNVNPQTADYVAALTDANGVVTMNKATANTFTVPANATVAFQVGHKLTVYQIGAGQTTIAAAAGVTILKSAATLKLLAQNSKAELEQTAANTWILSGEMAAS